MDLPERASLRDVLAYAGNSMTSRPYQMFKYCRPAVGRRLREKLSKSSYDLIICDFLLTAAVIPWNLQIPTVIFTHNVEAAIWNRHLALNRYFILKLVV